MRNWQSKTLVFRSLLLLIPLSTGYAQTIEQALWYELLYPVASARAAGIGIAFAGIADDGSAMLSNPAGLALIPSREAVAGFTITNAFTTISDLPQAETFHHSAFQLSDLHLVGSFKNILADRLILGGGFFLRSASQFSYSLSGMNIASSQLSLLDSYFQPYEKPPILDELRDDSLYTLPADDSLFYNATLSESGILYSANLAAAIDLSNRISFGLGINLYIGSYKISRSHVELDTLNIYHSEAPAGQRIPFDRLAYTENTVQTAVGHSISFGVMFRPTPTFRLGIGIESGPSFSLKNRLQLSASIRKDNGEEASFSDQLSANEYIQDLSYRIHVGASYHFPRYGLTLAAAARFSDPANITVTQKPSIILLNSPADTDLLPQQLLSALWTAGIGIELDPPSAWYAIRGGITLMSSPYRASSRLFPIVHAGAALYPLANLRVELFTTVGNFILPHQPLYTTYYPFTLSTLRTTVGMQVTLRFQ